MVATKLFFLLAFLEGLFWEKAVFSASVTLSVCKVGLPGMAGSASSALAGGVSSEAGTSIPDGGRKLVSDCPWLSANQIQSV